MSKKTVARFDLQKIDKAVKLDNGFLRAPVFATRTGVFKYYRSDGSVLREYRPESEVFKNESMATLGGVPLTNRHPTKLVDSNNAKKYTVGHVSDVVERDGKFLKTSVIVTHQTVIDEIEKKGLREVSCGYIADLDFTPGVTEDGEEYDAIQTNIRYNHLAVVDRGRAGPEVRLRLDAEGAICEDGLDLINPKPNKREESMAKVMIDGVEHEVEAGVATAINSALSKAREDGKKEAMKEEDEKNKKKTDALQAEIDEKQAKIDSLEEDNKKLKEDALDEEAIQKRVDARAALVAKATPLLKEDAEISKMSDLDIKKAVICEKTTLDAEDEKLKSEAYVDARFDAIIESAPESKKETKKDHSLRDALRRKEQKRADGSEDEDMTAEQVREKNMIADAMSWEKPIAGAATKPLLGGE